MKQRINSGVEIQVLQITHKINWALAAVKGIRKPYKAKEKPFDVVDIRSHDFGITVVSFGLPTKLRGLTEACRGQLMCRIAARKDNQWRVDISGLVAW